MLNIDDGGGDDGFLCSSGQSPESAQRLHANPQDPQAQKNRAMALSVDPAGIGKAGEAFAIGPPSFFLSAFLGYRLCKTPLDRD